MLNTLASHGFLPHAGKDIAKEATETPSTLFNFGLRPSFAKPGLRHLDDIHSHAGKI